MNFEDFETRKFEFWDISFDKNCAIIAKFLFFFENSRMVLKIEISREFCNPMCNRAINHQFTYLWPKKVMKPSIVCRMTGVFDILIFTYNTLSFWQMEQNFLLLASKIMEVVCNASCAFEYSLNISSMMLLCQQN